MKNVLIALLLGSAAALAQTPSNASMFRGSPSHAGIYQASEVPNLPAVKWKFKTNAYVVSSPAVADGVVYVGSNDHFLYAIDAATGRQKWKLQLRSHVNSSPAVANGVVYVGGMGALFYAIDAATGKEKWRFETAGEHRYTATHLHGAHPVAEAMPDPFDFYASSPAIVGDAIFFGSGDGNIYSLDAATGKLRWKFQTGNVVHASPAVADGVVYVGSWDSYFYALDANTGALKWKFKTGEDEKIHNQVGIQSSAAVVNGVVYFGCRDSNLYALDAKTGAEKWKFNNKGSWVINSPAVRDGKVYFSTSDSGKFYVVDANTGAELAMHKFLWPMFSSPALVGNYLYMGTHEGKLIAVDTRTNQPAWTFQTDGSKANGPTYTKPDGTPNYEAAFFDFFYDDMIVGVHKMMSVGAVLSSPVVVGKTIYFGSTDGNLYALE